MGRRQFASLFTLLFFLVAWNAATADEIEFTDGYVEKDVTVTSETTEKVYYKKGNIPLERSAFEVVRITYSNWPHNYTKGRDLLAQGNYSGAAGAFAQAAKFGSDERVKIYSLLGQGRALRAAGETQKAIRVYEEVIREFPKHRKFIDAQLGIGKAYLETGQYSKAKKAFQDFKEVATRNKLGEANISKADLYMAEVEAAQGNHRDARRSFLELSNRASIASIKYPAKIRAIAMLVKMGSHDMALDELKTFMQKDVGPEVLAEAYLLQGDALRARGDTKEALKSYLRVRLLYPNAHEFQPKAIYWASELFPKTDLPDKETKAQELKNYLKARYPRSEWAQK